MSKDILKEKKDTYLFVSPQNWTIYSWRVFSFGYHKIDIAKAVLALAHN